MALYESYVAAPKQVINSSLDITPYWIDDGLYDPGALWLQIVKRETTQAKAMTLAACELQIGVLVTSSTTAVADTTSCSYSRDGPTIDSYTFNQTVVKTGRIVAPTA